ncbi:hypothetical protein CYLTODRAFT_491227 [Cylindrobasidium torrendii FP15055 ss-10]|uniref:BRCT domain-containing protein n=1 Tax=Cylindrobasidium torrendii FP15055 ss-10 TaxID=1314674 RepID=A0A0D7B887_9AGAR|nr:hypothetical protein CYLTODRAFT_491227 [Cylindrobasidium torrendii FP15055 ss-10]
MNRRRGNKSHKVPGVKLRPVQPSKRHSRNSHEEEAESVWAEDTQIASGHALFMDNIPKPFEGLVICSTGVQDRADLYKKAKELGAQTENSFMTHVTHLIADTHGSDKYKCAVRHAVPIMLSTWITECYEVWLRGDDVDLQKSLTKYRLPVFTGLVLCISGFEDTKKSQIRNCIVAQKGECVEQITRPVKVTHLICQNDDAQVEQRRYAEKFNARGEANIQLVWEDWLWDCLKFYGRLDEADYIISRPKPEPVVAQPSQDQSTKDSAPNVERKNVQDSQDDDEAIVVVKQSSEVLVQLWASLLHKRGFGVSVDGKLTRAASAASQPRASPERPVSLAGGSVINKFRRDNAFAPELTPALSQPFATRNKTNDMAPTPTRKGLFAGMKFYLMGETKSAAVKTAIEDGGGQTVSSDEAAHFIVVRLLSGGKMYCAETDERIRAKYRTECWLEQSLHVEKICMPDEHLTFTPLAIQTPIPGVEKIRLSLSGLETNIALFTRRLLRVLGMEVEPVFSKKVTHLLCPSGVGAKYNRAREWGIPVIGMGWVEEAARTGELVDLTPYLVGGDAAPPQAEASDVTGGDWLIGEGTTEIQRALGDCPQSHHKPRAQAGPGPTTSEFRLGALLRGVGDLEVTTSKLSPFVHDPKGKGRAGEEAPMFDITNDIQYSTTYERNLNQFEQAPNGRGQYPNGRGSSPTRSQDAVPSSRTPSPMKINPSQDAIPSSRTPSPMKMPKIPSPVKVPKVPTLPAIPQPAPALGKRKSEDSVEERVDRRTRPRPARTKSANLQMGLTSTPAAIARLDGFEDSGSDGFGFGADDLDIGIMSKVGGMVYGDDSEKRRMMRMLDPQHPTT